MATKQSNVLDLTDAELRVAVAMRELRRGHAMQRLRDRIYGGDDSLDLAQHDALEVVVGLTGARMGDLATALRVDASTATRTVNRLEAAGLVVRQPDPADRRSVVVVTTAAGRRRDERLRQRARQALGELFARFDDPELATLAELMERLVDGLDELAADA